MRYPRILIIAVTVVFLQNLLGFVKISSTPTRVADNQTPQEVSTLIIENARVWTSGKDGLILINRSTGTRINPPEPVPSFG